MSLFNTGDRVVCVMSAGSVLVEGKIYTVLKVTKDVGEREDLALAEYPNSHFTSDRFKHFQMTGDPEIDRMLESCVLTLQTKGVEYTVGSEDKLANFRGVAQDVGIPMEKAWAVFFNKHLTALQSYIKNGCEVKSNESIHGRIMDLITYLLLFEKLTLEIERGREKR
jgi:hypothetical protein